jgi:uroporphyrinogen decarboxylase
MGDGKDKLPMSTESRYPGAPAPNQQGLINCLSGTAAPDRVYHLELFHDDEVIDALADRFHVATGLSWDDPFRLLKRQVALYRYLGFDAIVVKAVLPLNTGPRAKTDDTAGLAGAGKQRSWVQSAGGAISNWEDFERFHWPDPAEADFSQFQWATENVPEDTCLKVGSSHMLEHPMWIMGMEGFCIGIHEQPDLVAEVCRRCGELNIGLLQRMLQFDRCRIIFGSDDMGFGSGTFVSPAFLREHVLPWHKKAARMAHEAGRLYLLHVCGNVTEIMDDLIDDVKIDAKHSFQDTFESVIDAKRRYGRRVGLVGGADVDFLCRASIPDIRSYTRRMLDACMTGGRYCLGTGNSVANYIPPDHYLAMLEEGYGWRG